MKKAFLNFGNAPKITSRRFGNQNFRSAAYKSDGKTPEQLETEKKERKKLVDAAEKAWKDCPVDNPENVVKSMQLHAEFLKAQGEAEVKNFEEKIAAIEAAQKEAKDADEAKIKDISEKLDVTIKALDMVQVRMKHSAPAKQEATTFADSLKDAIDANHDNIQKFIRKETKRVELDVKAVGAVSTANVTGTTVWGAQYRNGIIDNPSRKTHLRELIPVMSAGPGTDFYFMKENGAGEGSIAPTSETTAAADPTTQATGLKPQFDVDLIESSVKFETIAGWMLMSKKSMNNIPGFLSFLQRRVPQLYLNVEDQQILYGTGTTPQIKGILVSGNFTAGSAAGATPLVEKIINDLSLLEDTHQRMANGILMRPADYYTFFKNKAEGSGEYDLPQGVSFVNGVLYILGVPVSTTTALTTNDYVVGDFVNGAELQVQEGMKIEFFEQDGTNVRTNQVTLRVEGTAALPVYGSNYFIKGSSATT